MTPKQAFATLGLGNYYGHCPSFGGGGRSHHWSEYYFRHSEYRLRLTYDMATRKINSAALGEVVWNANEKP